jgi:large subunit ribosomal protein L23
MAKKLIKKSDKQGVRESDYSTLVRPIVTEKASFVGQMGSCITFEVDRKATRLQVAEAVSRVYGVTVEKVRTLNFLGKSKRRGAQSGRSNHYKKAYITLAPGSTVDVIDGL